jgi:deaminated glutathione amidase
MKIAAIQFNATTDKADNLRRAEAMVQQALEKGAKFVALPEIFAWRGNARDKALLSEAAEPISGGAVKRFGQLAKEYQAHILLGSLFEKINNNHKVHNTSLLLGPDGTVQAKYRKINLFDARIGDKIIREADCLIPGRLGTMAKAGNFKIGMSICYDLRFAELYRSYGRKGVDILTVPSCFTKKTGQAHWEVLLRARAIENLCYVIAPNQVGQDVRGVESYGNSMIVSPWGEVIARASGSKQEIIYADINKEAIEQARAILPGIATRTS